MAIICNVCGYDQNPDGSEFCDACGAELSAVPLTPTPTPIPTVVLNPQPQPPTPTPIVNPTPAPVETFTPTLTPTPTPLTSPSFPQTATTARLISKQPNAPIPEFSIDSNALIGIFDPDMGPVEIDLEEFPGNETVSRNHAEIYPEEGVWKIKDLGSTNGVFIKPIGASRFGSRITTPTVLTSGDEIAIAKIRFLFQSP